MPFAFQGSVQPLPYPHPWEICSFLPCFKRKSTYQQCEIPKGLPSCLYHIANTEHGAGRVEKWIVCAALEIGGVVGLQSIAPETGEGERCHGYSRVWEAMVICWGTEDTLPQVPVSPKSDAWGKCSCFRDTQSSPLVKPVLLPLPAPPPTSAFMLLSSPGTLLPWCQAPCEL